MMMMMRLEVTLGRLSKTKVVISVMKICMMTIS